jgi:hypothetical protein
MRNIFEERKSISEAEINGNRVRFGACSSNSLEKAKEFYGKDWEYIGSGHKTWYDGVENNWKELHHFFVYNPKPPEVKPEKYVEKTFETSKTATFLIEMDKQGYKFSHTVKITPAWSEDAGGNMSVGAPEMTTAIFELK